VYHQSTSDALGGHTSADFGLGRLAQVGLYGRVRRPPADTHHGTDVDAALDKIEAGERYRGGWWRLVVRPGLEAAPDVEKPPRSGSEWTYTGDTDTLDESGPTT